MNPSLSRLTAFLIFAGAVSAALLPTLVSAAGTLSAGEAGAAAVTSSGQLATWGRNDAGQLGHSPSESVVALPRPVGGIASWSKVASGDRFTLALAADGLLYGWGDNGSGQLGSGSAGASSSSPLRVGLPSGAVVRDFVAGQGHALALVDLPGVETGVIFAWGANSSGQLGLGAGDFGGRFSPVRITAGELRFKAIAASDLSSFAIAEDGSLWAWGSNARGELGQGRRITSANIHSPVPLRVGKARNWTALAGGSRHVLAIAGGRVFAWGANDLGQCSGSGRGQVLAPAAITLSRAKNQPAFTVSAIAAGNSHSLALVSTGRVYAWGRNQSGELGRAPTPTGRNVIVTPTIIDQDDPASNDPRRRIALPAAAAIAAGGDFTLLAKLGGGYLGFGTNSFGQLGLGFVDATPFGSGVGREPLLSSPNLAVAAPGPVSSTSVAGVAQFGLGGSFGPLALNVRNAGFVAHNTGYRVAVYLSRDAVLDSSDRLLAEATEPASAFAAGALRATQFSASALAVPDVVAGSYFLLSQVVPLGASGGVITDAFAPDNGASVAVGVVAPDIGIFGVIELDRTVVGPGDAGFGDVSVTLTNANLGLVPAGRPILVEAYLSADDVLLPSADLLLKSIQVTPGVGGLPGGGTLLAAFGSVALPASVDGGDYSLFVVANRDGAIAESGASANAVRLPVRVSSHDLAASAPGLPEGALGYAVVLGNIPINVQNLGARAYSGAMLVELFVSTKTTFDFSAVKLGEQSLTGGLAAGGSRTAVIPGVALPVTLRDDVTFFARVTPDSALGDRFPANNLASVSVNLGRAALAISDVLFPNTTSVEAGGSLGAVTFRISNTGPGSVPAGFPLSVEVFLSADGTLDRNNDQLLSRYSYASGLLPGASPILAASSSPLSIPAGVPSGIYTLFIAVNADGGQALFPSVVQPSVINVGALDVSVTSPALPSATLGVNAVIQAVNGTVTNNGGFAVPPGLVVELYLSTNASFDNADTLLASTTVTTPVAAGASRSVSFADVIVPDQGQGNFHLINRVILPEGLGDTQLSNNVAATAVSISRPLVAVDEFVAPAYLDLDNFAPAPAPTLQGVQFTLANTTPGVLPAGTPLSYEIYLSRDDLLDSRDVLLRAAATYTGGLAAVPSSELVGPFDVPVTGAIVGGTYQLLVVVNRDGAAVLGNDGPILRSLPVIFRSQNAPGDAVDYGTVAFSGSGDWTAISDTRATGRTAYQSPTLAAGQQASLSLTVTGPTELRVPWKLFPGTGDSVRVERGGVLINTLAQADAVFRLSGPGQTPIQVPSGEHLVTFTYAESGNLPNPPGARAVIDLDVPAFVTSGDGDWFGPASSEAKVNGSYARSPRLAQGQQASLEVKVEGPAQVSFWWRATGVAGQDTLGFFIDGQPAFFPTTALSDVARVAQISDQPGWQRVAFLIGAGERTLRWSYTQGSAQTSSQGNLDGLVVSTPVPASNTLAPGDLPSEHVNVPTTTVDLAIVSASAPPGTYLLDDAQNGTGRLPLSVTFENAGRAFAANPAWTASNLEVRLSTDKLWGNADDIPLGHYARFQALQVGQRVNVDAELNLPLDLPSGNYFLLVRVLGGAGSPEFTFANNTVILGDSGPDQAYAIRRAPDLGVADFSGLSSSYPYHPEDAAYVGYDLRNLGLGDINPTDRFKVRLSLFATLPGITDITKATLIRSFPDREFSVFIPAARAAYPDASQNRVTVTHFVDLPSERDILVALGAIIAGTPEDSTQVSANRAKLRDSRYFFQIIVDTENTISESSETNVFWLGGSLFNIVPVAFAQNAGELFGDTVLGSFISQEPAFVAGTFDFAAVPPASGSFTDYIWDYTLVRAPAGSPQLLYQQDVQNDMLPIAVPPAAATPYNTLTFDFNLRATDVRILVQATDDSVGGVWESVLTLEPPYNQISGSRSLTGYGGLSGSPYVVALEGNATFVQKSHAAHITVRDRLSIAQRGSSNNPRMRLVVEPVAGITVPAAATNLAAFNVDASVEIIWSGALPVNSGFTQGAWIVERSRNGGATWRNLGPTVVSRFTDSAPGTSGTNTYRVRAVTAAGVSATTQISITLR